MAIGSSGAGATAGGGGAGGVCTNCGWVAPVLGVASTGMGIGDASGGVVLTIGRTSLGMAAEVGRPGSGMAGVLPKLSALAGAGRAGTGSDDTGGGGADTPTAWVIGRAGCGSGVPTQL